MAVSVVVSGVIFGVLRSMSGAHSVVVSVVLFLSTTELEAVEAVVLLGVGVGVVVGFVGVVVDIFDIPHGITFVSETYHGAAPVGVLIMFSGHFLIYHGFAPVAVLIIGTVLCIGVVVFLVVVIGDFKSLVVAGIGATDHFHTTALFFTGLIGTGLNPQKEVPKVPPAPPPQN